jgi:hypothetical protein
MGITKGLSRLGVLLGSLGVIAVAFAGAAPASLAMIPAPGDTGGATGTDTVRGTSPVIHTVVVGGMPGWQIASIAIVAAMVAAVAAVLADRARGARRRLLGTPA